MARNSPSLRMPSSRKLVDSIVHEPRLAAIVQSLAPRSLGKLINHVGLEDSGELISLATTEQIEKIFDEDLWTHDQPGAEERFDGDRFVLWLQVMLEVGERFAAEKLEEFPEDLVVLALQRSILVVDSDVLQAAMGDDDESDMTEKALESSLYEEFDEYMVLARRHEGWDAILAVLVALDASNRTLLRRLLERCCFLSHEYIEDNGGLYDVLTSEEMLESDLAGEREDRRSREGFVAPAAAASFLNLARRCDPETLATMGRDPVARAYFRHRRSGSSARSTLAPASFDARQDVLRLEALIATLDGEPRLPDARVKSLPSAGAPSDLPNDGELFRRTLARLAERNTASHEQRLDEMAFLCNVLVSGNSIVGRVFRPYEAIVAAAAICNLGMERLVGAAADKSSLDGAARVLEERGADGVFRLGLWILHHEVAGATLAALAIAIDKAAAGRPNLDRLRVIADAARKAEKPWRFGRALFDLHELFDDATLGMLQNLLGECPILTGQLAHPAGGPYGIDRARRFIATHADVREVQRFVRGL